MKYIKVTMALFIVSLCFGLMGVNATQFTKLINITIPSWSGNFISKEVDKGNDWTYNQKVKKTYAKDNVSGDPRALSANLYGMYGGMSHLAEWKSIPQDVNVEFDNTKTEGAWKLYVRSDKSLLTTVTASIDWDLGTISQSPYPVLGE